MEIKSKNLEIYSNYKNMDLVRYFSLFAVFDVFVKIINRYVLSIRPDNLVNLDDEKVQTNLILSYILNSLKYNKQKIHISSIYSYNFD